MSRLCANKEKLKEIWRRKEKRRELGAKMSGGRSTWLHLAAPANLQNLRIPGAELQNGGRSRHAEKAGCEKQGGPPQS